MTQIKQEKPWYAPGYLKEVIGNAQSALVGEKKMKRRNAIDLTKNPNPIDLTEKPNKMVPDGQKIQGTSVGGIPFSVQNVQPQTQPQMSLLPRNPTPTTRPQAQPQPQPQSNTTNYIITETKNDDVDEDLLEKGIFTKLFFAFVILVIGAVFIIPVVSGFAPIKLSHKPMTNTRFSKCLKCDRSYNINNKTTPLNTQENNGFNFVSFSKMMNSNVI